MRGPRVAPSEDNGHYSLQMSTNNGDELQDSRAADRVELTEMLAKRIRERLGLDAGQVTVEDVVSDGGYLRGFVKLGPLTPEQVRELAR